MFSAGVPPRFRERGYFCSQKAMRILIYLDNLIPARTYGGTERVMWYLGKELARMGHRVYFLCHPGSTCDFATVIPHDPRLPFDGQVPAGVDVIHFNNCTMGRLEKPYIVTHHGNFLQGDLDRNSVFVSADHARRHGSASFVYNGLDWSDYGDPGLRSERRYYHFLGKAAWRIKNVQGAIDTVKALPGERLLVLGGYRLNLKMGLRLTLTPKARFAGMVGGERKNELLRHSKGLIFPVRWDEPFGLAITESLYFGAPVFGTPYGSLPELVPPEVGFLTNREEELVAHLLSRPAYSARTCHEWARERFNSRLMAEAYLRKYEQVLDGEALNPEPPHALVPDRKREWIKRG